MKKNPSKENDPTRFFHNLLPICKLSHFHLQPFWLLGTGNSCKVYYQIQQSQTIMEKRMSFFQCYKLQAIQFITHAHPLCVIK